MGTFGVLEYCRQHGAKLIYAGSSTKFADGGLGRDQSPYAWTKATNTELVMNYATSAAGSVQVELQYPQGVPLPGFALADSEVMYGDSLEQPMLWRGNPDLGALAGTPLRLRFTLRDADLFSFRFR